MHTRAVQDLGLRPHLAAESVPAGEQRVLAETRGRSRVPSPPCGGVHHLQLSVAQRPVDGDTQGFPRLLVLGTAQPCGTDTTESLRGFDPSATCEETLRPSNSSFVDVFNLPLRSSLKQIQAPNCTRRAVSERAGADEPVRCSPSDRECHLRRKDSASSRPPACPTTISMTGKSSSG